MSILSKIKSVLGMREKPPSFSVFPDPLGNFIISYPSDWRFDRDIAVVGGKYMISFESQGGRCCFSLSLDTALEPKFSFSKYAKSELSTPTAGILADLKRCRFRGMPAYRRDYTYIGGGTTYFGGGIMFFTGSMVFSAVWNAPEKDRGKYEKIFEGMLESLLLPKGPHR